MNRTAFGVDQKSGISERLGFVAVAIGTYFLYLPVLQPLLFGDAFKIIGAYQHPASGSLSFWWEVFTSPNNGPQYRPYSYLAHFSLLRTIFGLDPNTFHVISFFIFVAAGYQFFKYLKNCTTHPQTKWVGALLFFISPHFLRHVGYFVFTPKYVLPLFCLFYSFNQIHKLGKKNTSWVILTCLAANAFAITNHEAAFIFVAFQFAEIYRVRKEYLLPAFAIAIPAAMYLLARLFVWKVPQSGFMSLDFSNAPQRFFVLMGTLWNTGMSMSITTSQAWHGLLITLLAVGVGIFLYCRHKFVLPLQLIAASLASALPFSLLFEHFATNRAVWSSCFFIAFLVVVYDRILILAPHRKQVLHFSLAVFVTFAFFAFVKESNQEEHRFAQRANACKNALIDLKRALGTPSEPMKIVIKPSFEYPFESYVLETMLAYYYPQSTFYIENQHPDVATQLIHKGMTYSRYDAASEHAVDIFGITQNMTAPHFKKIVTLE